MSKCSCKFVNSPIRTSDRLKNDGRTSHPMYESWKVIKRRCRPNSKNSNTYYERGIGICYEWAVDFWSFFECMGYRPEGLSIDRVNNDIGYCPHNCRWATTVQQAANRRKRDLKIKSNRDLPVGVTKFRGRYKVQFTVNKKCRFIGYFENKNSAIKACKMARDQILIERQNLNKI